MGGRHRREVARLQAGERFTIVDSAKTDETVAGIRTRVVPTPEEAIEPASDTEFGLSAGTVIAAGTVTDDHTETSRFVAAVDFGVLKVNETTTGVEFHVLFSGMNASFSAETYRERGEEGWTTSPSRPSTIAAESRTVGKFQSH